MSKREVVFIQLGTTMFLRAAVLASAAVVGLLCVLVIPAILSGWADEYPSAAGWQYPIAVGLSVTALAFFAAAFQTMKLLSYVDQNKAFSNLSVKALRLICGCGLLISVLYAAGLPLAYYVAQQEDAPGIIVIGMIISFAAFVVAVFAAVLERLLRSAIVLQSENDLTV